MTTTSSVVYVVDDDASVRTSLGRLLRSAGYGVETFGSAEEFLEKNKNIHHCCLILDLRMPGLNGTQLQEELTKRNIFASIVFISGHGDIRSSVRAMKNGAVDFLPKPYDQSELLAAVEKAFLSDVLQQTRQRGLSRVNRHLGTLTERESEVLRWVISGRLNKQIAQGLGITEKTIKVHRGKVMEKMKVSSVAELVRAAEVANIQPVPKK